MPQSRVWIGDPLTPQAQAIFESVAEVFVSKVGELNDWYTEAANADALFLRGNTRFTGIEMDRVGPRLRIIARAGIGVDAIDLDAATQRGIQVVNTPDGPTESTAEHAVALLLNLLKQVMIGDRVLRSGTGFPSSRNTIVGVEALGTTLGLVGLGRIGSRVATIANALGMRVLSFDPFVTPQRAASLQVEMVPSLTELLSLSRVISLHCPSTPETYHIINAQTLALMPESSFLINVARGALIDHSALLAALLSGHIAGAGLDVFEPEPPLPNDPLFSLPNIICTPHIGSFTAAGLVRMQVMASEQVVSALRGKRPTNLVNSAVWGHQRT
jgi:D-3-phosphoglycerate dehydrogenase / 2-oxoglutarate reductase